MTIKSSGSLSLTDIATEFGGAKPYNLSGYYSGGARVPADATGQNGPIPSSGEIKFSDFYGSTVVPKLQKGYFVGVSATNNDGIDALMYTSETVYYLSQDYARPGKTDNLSGVGSSTDAYFSGGTDGGSSKDTAHGYADLIVYIKFSTDATSSLSSYISQMRNGMGSFSSPAKGYFCSGILNDFYANVPYTGVTDALTFSNNTCVSLASAVLQVPRKKFANAQTFVKGYLFGGATSTVVTNRIDALPFSTETFNQVNSYLVRGKTRCAGAWGPTKAYVAGGWDDTSGSSNTIESFTYASETMSNTSAVLYAFRLDLSAAVSTTKGYFSGGGNIDRFVFSSETNSLMANTLKSTTFNKATASPV